MKKRYLYALLFGVPGFFASGIVSLFILGGVIGILWLFVFGDNPWPFAIDQMAAVLLLLIFLPLWIGSLAAGYAVGKRLEKDPVVNRTHILISSGLTVLILLFIVFQQWSVGNLGPKSDSVLCSDYCIQQGYSGSGTPPQDSGERTCSCFDDAGTEVLKVPLDGLDSETP